MSRFAEVAFSTAPQAGETTWTGLARAVLLPRCMLRHLLFVVSLGACGVGGALDQATLAGECEGQSGCVDELSAGPLAVGGTVPTSIRIDSGGSGTAVLELLAADPDVIAVTGHQVTGVRPGMSAVLVIEKTTGSVVDFFHLFVAEPDRLELARLGGVGAGADLAGDLELLEGDEVTLGVIAFRGPQRLVGTGDVSWSVEGDAVRLLSDGNPDRQRMVARTAGTATVSIDSMGMTQTLAITVYP